MSQTRAQIRSIGDVLSRKGQEFYFVDPLMISAPSSTIYQLNGAARQLPDPSKRMAPFMAMETIQTATMEPIVLEKGLNGEPIYRIPNDERVRFAGSWDCAFSSSGQRVASSVQNSYIEFSFAGTGAILLLANVPGSTLDVRASVDGGAEGANIIPNSGVLATAVNGRGGRSNHPVRIVTGLAYGNHTVKLRIQSSGVTLAVGGVQILNTATQMRMLAGELYANGTKYLQGATELFAYNSGFDGSPVLNGRGGRVHVYKGLNGILGRAIQQADATPLYLDSADHTNEEVIRRFNWREFGQARADDFSTLSTSSTPRGHTMEDGITSLSGIAVLNDSSEEGVRQGGGSSNYLTLTFVGTGLDVLTYEDNGGQQTSDLIIDGVTVSAAYGSALNGRRYIKRICSGLPFGTHTVRWLTTTAASGNYHFVDFIVYGPKKPTIPAGAAVVGEYYLLADYVQNSSTALNAIPRGVLRKDCTRDWVYADGSGGTINWTALGTADPNIYTDGQEISTDRTGFAETEFFGTGFEYRATASAARASQIAITLNGIAFTTANFGAAASGATVYGDVGLSWNATTGVLDFRTGGTVRGCGFRVNGLPLSQYRMRMTNLVAGESISIEKLDVICPIYSTDGVFKAPFSHTQPKSIFNRYTDLAGLDLAKPRAWVHFNPNNGTIFSSFNVTSVIKITTGAYGVYFKTPFKVAPGVVGNHQDNGSVQVNQLSTSQSYSVAHQVVNLLNNSGTAVDSSRATLVFFGELVDEEPGV